MRRVRALGARGADGDEAEEGIQGEPRERAGVRADPELPGFDSREQVIGRYQDLLGRKLIGLDFYEMFSMVRMACCILRSRRWRICTGRNAASARRAS